MLTAWGTIRLLWLPHEVTAKIERAAKTAITKCLLFIVLEVECDVMITDLDSLE